MCSLQPTCRKREAPDVLARQEECSLGMVQEARETAMQFGMMIRSYIFTLEYTNCFKGLTWVVERDEDAADVHSTMNIRQTA